MKVKQVVMEKASIFSLLKHSPPLSYSNSPRPPSSNLKTGISTFPPSSLSTSRSRSRSRSRHWKFTLQFVKTPKSNFHFQFNNRDDNTDDADYPDKSPLPWDERFLRGFDEFTDTVFIFKVFKSYGWFLPPILLSLLLTSGLKAFLLALAPALGFSALYLAFQTLAGPIRMNTNRTTRRPNKQAKKVRVRAGKRKMGYGYQSWVARNAGSVDKNITQDGPSFNGWDDELDSPRSYNTGSMQKMAATTSVSRKPLMEEEKLAGSGERSETPLILRLLLAVFPFLSSWTKLLM